MKTITTVQLMEIIESLGPFETHGELDTRPVIGDGDGEWEPLPIDYEVQSVYALEGMLDACPPGRLVKVYRADGCMIHSHTLFERVNDAWLMHPTCHY